jgi:hypothetical protein
MPENFGRQENERGQLPGKYGWWHNSSGSHRQISWYDMIRYVFWLQLGWHPVAEVHYTFTHKSIYRITLWNRIHRTECT